VGEVDPIEAARKAVKQHGATVSGERCDGAEAFPESNDNHNNAGSRQRQSFDYDALEQAALENLMPL
jgi:hypothetical protein